MVGETLGEDHEGVPFRFLLTSPEFLSRHDYLMLPNGDWLLADRPACAALAGQLPDAQQIVTILDHLSSCLPRTARGRGFAFNITDGGEDTTNKPSASGSPVTCQAAGFVVARAFSSIASAAAKAVMFRMPRTVALCVRT